MAVLVIHLDKESIEKREKGSLSGLELAISLYHEYEELSPIVISSPSAEAVRFNGSAFFSFVFRSPITERMAIASSGFAPGYSLYRLGYEAVVITGRARRLQILSITADGAERESADSIRGLSSIEAEKAAAKHITDIALTIGRAGENGVLFAALQSGGREVASQGLGCLFGWKNLKMILLPGFNRKDDIKNDKAERKVRRRQERNRYARKLRKEGSGVFIDAALKTGSLPVLGYIDRFDPRAYFLDGKALMDQYGVFPESCQECYFSCGRRTRDNAILPTCDETAMLGSNLGFFSLENVRKLSDAVREEGLGAADTGALLSSLPSLRGKSAEEYVRMIHVIGENRVYGDKLSQGLKAIPDAIATSDHLPILTDLRGDKTGALLAMLGLPIKPFSALLIPKKPLSDEAGAIMALYESAYHYALVSDGYCPMGALTEWWGRFPSFVFRYPFILRVIALLFRAYGKKGRDLFQKGMRIIKEIRRTEYGSIPDAFSSNPLSAYEDAVAVSPVRLVENYEREKRIAEMVLKSRREKSSNPSSDSTAAVGPSDERGLDGDPGLQ